MTFPRPLRDFVELFEARRFWDSHEALEEAWRDSRSDFYHGLILYASAWVHWKRRNAHGVRAQLAKAQQRLSTFPEQYLGLDVAAIRTHCASVSEVVSEDADGWPDRVRPLSLELEVNRLRGDEAELQG